MLVEVVYIEKEVNGKTYKNYYLKSGEVLIGIQPAGSWEKGKNAYALRNLHGIETLARKYNDKD